MKVWGDSSGTGLVVEMLGDGEGKLSEWDGEGSRWEVTLGG